MSSMIRTMERNNIKRLASLYKKYENRKVKHKKGKPIELKVNRFDLRRLLAKAFKGDIKLLKVGERVLIKDNKADKKIA